MALIVFVVRGGHVVALPLPVLPRGLFSLGHCRHRSAPEAENTVTSTGSAQASASRTARNAWAAAAAGRWLRAEANVERLDSRLAMTALPVRAVRSYRWCRGLRPDLVLLDLG